MQKHKRIVCALLAVCLCLGLGTTALSAGNPLIEPGQTGSLDIYKYDLTRAAGDNAWSVQTNTGGEASEAASSALAAYALEGVGFTYLRLAAIETYQSRSADGSSMESMVLYGFARNEASTTFLSAINLPYSEAHHTAEDGGVPTSYFTSDALTGALAGALAANATNVKNALETLVRSQGGTAMALTDGQGHTGQGNLPLGLYLLVETSVPENVTDTTDPFLVSLPSTNAAGTGWNYQVHVYPKNETGSPTLEKTVRESAGSTGTNGGSGSVSDGYDHSASASVGDTLEYQILSTLPAITSAASALTAYTFEDRLSPGLTYVQDQVSVEFFRDGACTQSVARWAPGDGKFTLSYTDGEAGQSMTLAMTEAGLAEINGSEAVHGTAGPERGYSRCTMRITYSALLNGKAVLGEAGNPNTVTLTWSRTSTDYYDTLRDDAHVHTYGLALTKKFSDGQGNAAAVKFVLRNETDQVYITADKTAEGMYTVSGFESSREKATVFSPGPEGKLVIRGLEPDVYALQETETAGGYTLLQDDVIITITASDGEDCPTCGGKKLTGSAAVDGADVTLSADGDSGRAFIPFTIENTRGYTLPETGARGNGIYAFLGLLLMAAAGTAFGLLRRRKSREGR